MLHVALWEPEIPPNTGNIARTCAANNVMLHLIGKLGFSLDEKAVRRAGLDYWPHVMLTRHETFADFEKAIGIDHILVIECPSVGNYTQATFHDGDCLLFGNESSGLPRDILDRFTTRTFSIPMPSGHVRSLNLATSVGIVLYEALRQLNKW
jgi:tRNA (cytidine/uridine-2'-O-)-methyltransferase